MTIDRPVRILLVSGSLRAGSTNTALLTTAVAVAPEGVVTTFYDGLDSLPHFNPDDDVEGEPLPAAAADLRVQLDAADAVLFSTPEYAGALPGSFKNFLDWTVGGGTYEKPVAWVNASSSPTGAASAHDRCAPCCATRAPTSSSRPASTSRCHARRSGPTGSSQTRLCASESAPS